MNIFSKDTELADRLEATHAENEELQGLVVQRESEIKDLSEKLAELSTGIEAQAAELEEFKAANANLEVVNSELAEQITASKEAQEDFDSKVEAAACAKLAELGTPEPVATTEEDEDTDIYGQYRKLQASNPSQASAFWNENRDKILAQTK